MAQTGAPAAVGPERGSDLRGVISGGFTRDPPVEQQTAHGHSPPSTTANTPAHAPSRGTSSANRFASVVEQLIRVRVLTADDFLCDHPNHSFKTTQGPGLDLGQQQSGVCSLHTERAPRSEPAWTGPGGLSASYTQSAERRHLNVGSPVPRFTASLGLLSKCGKYGRGI